MRETGRKRDRYRGRNILREIDREKERDGGRGRVQKRDSVDRIKLPSVETVVKVCTSKK